MSFGPFVPEEFIVRRLHIKIVTKKASIKQFIPKCYNKRMRERMFEITLLLVGLIGLLILFTLLYAGPKFVLRGILNYF